MQYRAIVKSRLNISSKSILNTFVEDFEINIDILNNQNSMITLRDTSNNISIGDIIIIINNYGKKIYQGVIKRIDDNILDVDQIETLLTQKLVYKKFNFTTIEQEIKQNILENFINSNDDIIKSTFKDFVIEILSNTVGNLPTKEEKYVFEFIDFIYALFESYDIIIEFDIPLNEGVPKIKIKKNQLKKLRIINNTSYIQNIESILDITEINKITIYSQDGNYRATYYGLTDGSITNNASALLRPNVVLNEIIYSDDDFNTIVDSSLRTSKYNHRIKLDIQFNDNKLYNIDDFSLGRKFEVFKGLNEFYDTILTSISFGYNINEGEKLVSCVFGKVRLDFKNELKI